MPIMMEKTKKGMPVIVEDKHELYAGTVVEIDQPTGEIGVRRESSGESQLIPFGRVHLSFRKDGGTHQPLSPSTNSRKPEDLEAHIVALKRKMGDLEAYIVALNKGQISPGGLTEIATMIEAKTGPVRDIRTQELVKYY